MPAITGIIRNRQVILPDGCPEDFEGRNVLVTVLEAQNPQGMGCAAESDLAASDPFDRYVGGWTSFNNDTPVAQIVTDMREGRKFDF